jgi:preprotein translocase subunit SecA
MKEGIREETVGFLFNLEVQVEPEEEIEDTVIEEGALSDTTAGPHVQVHDDHVHAHAPHITAKGLQAPKAPQNLTYTAPSEDGEAEVRGQTASNADDPFAGAGRNAECPCGSGLKYKKCHGAPGGRPGLTTRAKG